jgi:L,D-peptidoglycan transpeptidase YkuD (ErfK/YbiS/YcfS/YnhG family)
LRAADVLSDVAFGHRQVVVVLADEVEPTQATISAWELAGEWWNKVFAAMPAVIGRHGFAPPGEKREGDGRTPSGSFSLKRAFGYAASARTGLEYRQANSEDFWVDDPESAQYNQWVTGTPQASSFEVLKRPDDLYKQVIVIEYNTGPIVPGHGSAIFLHNWRNKKTPTAGCVALSARNVKKLLKWLDVSREPLIVLGDEEN